MTPEIATNARSDLLAFLRDFDNCPPVIADDADLFELLGLDGDDATDFIERFSARFSVDISDYRWYFHHGEEGLGGIGALFFGPPNSRVTQIPITPDLLATAIQTKRWPVEYPAHTLPRVRWDHRLNMMFALALGALLASVIVIRILG